MFQRISDVESEAGSVTASLRNSTCTYSDNSHSTGDLTAHLRRSSITPSLCINNDANCHVSDTTTSNNGITYFYISLFI